MAKVTALKTPSKSKKPELEVSVSDEEPSESKDSDPDVWATKGILKEQTRKKNGKSVLYYLIEWEGDWYNSWEPAENVGLQAIEFWEAKKQSKTAPDKELPAAATKLTPVEQQKKALRGRPKKNIEQNQLLSDTLITPGTLSKAVTKKKLTNKPTPEPSDSPAAFSPFVETIAKQKDSGKSKSKINRESSKDLSTSIKSGGDIDHSSPTSVNSVMGQSANKTVLLQTASQPSTSVLHAFEEPFQVMPDEKKNKKYSLKRLVPHDPDQTEANENSISRDTRDVTDSDKDGEDVKSNRPGTKPVKKPRISETAACTTKETNSEEGTLKKHASTPKTSALDSSRSQKKTTIIHDSQMTSTGENDMSSIDHNSPGRQLLEHLEDAVGIGGRSSRSLARLQKQSMADSFKASANRRKQARVENMTTRYQQTLVHAQELSFEERQLEIAEMKFLLRVFNDANDLEREMER